MSKHKDHKALVGRVKKAVKKTRRKLSEDQFHKELQRTINFLSEIKDHVGHLQTKEKAVAQDKAKSAAATVKPAAAKPKTKPAKPGDPKSGSKDAAKNAKPPAAPAAAKK